MQRFRQPSQYPHAPSVELTRSPGSLVVAFAAVLGSATVEKLVKHSLITRSRMVFGPAKASKRPTQLLLPNCQIVCLRLLSVHAQTQRFRPPSQDLYALRVELTSIQASSVVAFAVVLGSENAEILGTQSSIILGLMACRPAKVSRQLHSEYCCRIFSVGNYIFHCL